MADNDKIVTKESLREFYNQIQPYLNGGANTGYTPVGTVISIMSNEAPQHYLKCDGSIYNIVDYEELANHFATQFGSSNFFGGNGTTTFAVPDLRGEFLRGTGTNSHIDVYLGTKNGDGASVGVHQDATKHLNICALSNRNGFYLGSSASTSTQTGSYDKDASSGSNVSYRVNASGSASTTATSTPYYVSRPTNTSVLYCIATKDIYIDARYDYDTSEKVVGTWIDGKPIYQKIFTGTLSNSSTDVIITLLNNIDAVINANGYISKTGSKLFIPSQRTSSTFFEIWVENNNLLFVYQQGWSFTDYVVAVQYTKTTDT